MPRILPVLLSGGVGSRLWPLSRALFPKQLIALTSHRTMLQETALRVRDAARFQTPLTICNADHRFIVAEQLRGIGLEGAPILLEPMGRNTGPAACLAALYASRIAPDQLVLLLASDHVIGDGAAFRAAIDIAAAAAAAGRLVTFGIAPDRPDTGYGYIRRGAALAEAPGAFAVDRFVEKPDAATAQGYLDQGGYAWNGGIFLFRADVLLAGLERHAPEIVSACRAALDQGRVDGPFQTLDAAAFGLAPAIALDYAVMEKTDRAATVPVEMGWSDVGSWNALWQVRRRDGEGNYAEGDVVLDDVRNSYLCSTGPLVAGLGLRDMVVVATEDAVFVSPRNRAHEVGRLVNGLKAQNRSEITEPKEVRRPWGSYRSLDSGSNFQVKHLTINPGAMISLQYHRHRAEHWVVVKGCAQVTRGEAVMTLQENQSVYIPPLTVHRLANEDTVPLHVVEVQSGDYLGEDDIVRLTDIYGRKIEDNQPL